MQPTTMALNGIACNPIKALGKLTLNITIAGLEVPDIEFFVLPTNCPTLIGQTLIRHPMVKSLNLNSTNSTATFTLKSGETGTTKCYAKPDKLFWQSQPNSNSCHDEDIAITKELQVPQFNSIPEKLKWVKENMKLQIEWPDINQASEFADLCIENKAAFGFGGEMGKFPRKVRIPTNGESRAKDQHNIPRAHRKLVDAEIEMMLKNDIIEPCPDNKGFKTPIFLVNKKNGKMRPVMNFKDTLNRVLKDPDPYPMPSTDKTFATFTPGNSFFSSFDLTKGYWQIEIAEEDRHKTSFFWNGQNYQFKRLPFGMTSSGNTFSRELYEVFKSCNFSAENVLFYLDDITIFAKTWEDFIKNHKLFFEAIIKNGLKLNPEKCLVLKNEVPFLGRIIGKEGMKPDPRHVEALNEIQPPRTWKQLQALCGRLVWLSDFVGTKLYEPVKSTSFATLMQPIYALLRNKSKGVKFHWSDEADLCLKQLKKRITKSPFIQFADPSLPFTLTTDASGEGAAGVLMQIQNGQYKVIAAVSTTFNATQRNWSATEKEAYAILWSCERLEYFLSGNSFTIFTDHKSLVFLDKRTFGNAKIANWQQKLSRFRFCVQYIEGTKNVLADWLSRKGDIIEKPGEDPTPAGKFLMLKGTDLKIYIPSWCDDETARGRPELAEFMDTDERASFSAVATFLCQKELEPNPALFRSLELATQQREDSFFGPIMEALEKNSYGKSKLSLGDVMDPQDSKYEFYKKYENDFVLDSCTKVLFINKNGVNQMVVPSNYRKHILYGAHDGFGHCGIDRMTHNLRNFVWEGKLGDIQNYLASCNSCSRRKGRYGQRPLTQGHNLRGKKPFDVLYVDFICMPTARGLKYCLTIMDSFSKYAEAYPSAHDRAIDAARALSRFITRHGVAPQVISSDRGKHFVGSVFTETCKYLGIKTKLHVAWNPKSCAILERWHRTLKNALFIISKERNCLWPDILDYTVQALNANYNAATKTSPFYCIFGRHYNIALPTLSEKEVATNPLSHGMAVNSTLQMAHKFVKLCNQDADLLLDQRTAKTHKKSLLQIGDKVALYRPHSVQNDSKLPWIGDFTITECNDYVAKISGENNWTDWVHLSQLKKLQLRDPDLLLDTEEDSTPILHDLSSKPKSEGVMPTKVATPKPKPVKKKVSSKPPPSVPVRKSSRNSKPVQPFNISSTKNKSYAAVAKS